MTRQPAFTRALPARGSGGFSLVELMIAITLGLIILAGVTSIFLGSKRSFSTQGGMSQVQESGRFVNYLVFPYLRLAGFLPEPRVQINPADHFRGPWRQLSGSDNSFFAAGVAGIASVRPNTDALLVTYGGGATTLPTCDGDTVNAGQIAANVFFVSAADAAGLSSLSCAAVVITPGAGAALISPTTDVDFTNDPPMPLIYGVQDMQILYGVDTNDADDNPLPPALPGFFPNRYVRADQIPAIDPVSGFSAGWDRVVSVQIEFTTASSEQTEGDDVIGAGAGSADDFVRGRRLQRVFSSTLQIRNRLRS